VLSHNQVVSSAVVMIDQLVSSAVVMIDQLVSSAVVMIDQLVNSAVVMIDQLVSSAVVMIDQLVSSAVVMIDQLVSSAVVMIDQLVSSAHLAEKKTFILCPDFPTGESSSLNISQLANINFTSFLNSSRTLYMPSFSFFLIVEMSIGTRMIFL